MVVRDRLEVFTDIQLQVPGLNSGLPPGMVECLEPSLSLAAGIAMVDEVPLKNRFTDVHQGMVKDALGETGRMDGALFRFVHLESVVPTECKTAVRQLLTY